MDTKTLINGFVENEELFKQGAETLKKVAKDNDYKLRADALQVMLDEISDKIGQDAYNFYQLCIPYAVETA